MRLVLLIFVLISVGCGSPECETLKRCCEASAELPGMGGACGMANDVTDPAKCQSITDTIRTMYERREVPVPAVCESQS